MDILAKANLLNSVKPAEAFVIAAHDQQSLQHTNSSHATKVQISDCQKHQNQQSKNHVPTVAVNPTNLSNILVHALPGANPVSTLIPKVTLLMFAENKKIRIS